MRHVRSDEIERMQEDLVRLAPWNQNLHLPGGVQTAPERGDGAGAVWRSLCDHLPTDLRGKTVLDVGCNAGHHSFELAKRGAEVLGIDPDPRCLEQARWARKKLGLHNQVRFRRMQVYDLAQYERTFDIVLCLDVFQYLRYPMLALDLLVRRTRDLFVFQSLKRRSPVRAPSADDMRLRDLGALEREDWPCLYFIPGRLHDDPDHWWVPNQEAVAAMLRSAGFEMQRRIDGEVYLCRPDPGPAVERHAAELLSATGQPWRKHAGPRFDAQERLLVRA